jgi:hypothetical protein
MTAGDRYRIATNIAAKLGLDHPQFITEYSRAISQTHAMDSMAEMAPIAPPMGQTPPMAQNNAQGMPTEPLGAGGMPTTPQEPMMP